MNKATKKFIVFILLCLSFLFIQNIVYADSTVTIPAVGNFNQTSAYEVLNLVNQQRQNNGKPPLKWDADLEAIAMQRAVECAGYFSHVRPSGESCWTALDDLGIEKYYYVNGENIALGQTSPASAMNSWMNSTGHRENILSSNYNCVGIARCGNSWVQYFGSRPSTINETASNFVGSKSYNVKIKDGVIALNFNSISFDFGEVDGDLLNDDAVRAYVTTTDQKLLKDGVTWFGAALEYPLDKNSLTFISSNNNILQVSGKTVIANDVGNADLTFKYGDLSTIIPCSVSAPNMANILFDAQYYADKYPDLKSAYNYDEGALRSHYEAFGKAEGRQASPVFDVKYYLANNSDLANIYQNNYVEAFNHFVAYGIAEFRKSSPEYWGEFYRANNNDLNGFSNYRLIMHYLNFGRKEGRKANENVPAQTPAPAPTPSPVAQASSALENIVFNARFYADANPDIARAYGFDESALRAHWEVFGQNEGRVSSPVFDVKYYVENNSDLKSTYQNNYKGAISHFMIYGIKEGRKSSKIFDVKFYLDNNKDLKNTFNNNYQAGFEHFINFGCSEVRKTSSEFDVSVYKNSNNDLSNSFNNTWRNYYVHYIAFGSKENRKCV